MGKKRCWLGWVKRLFISEAKAKPEKKSRKWRWFTGRLKFKQYHPALPAQQITLCEATEAQRKHALNVAIATAAAAEAAVAAAQAAAEVVRLAGASKSYHRLARMDRNLAAITIQSAFRAYLARKALRALKGLVRLQAIVRGRAVRRQTTMSLKSLPSNSKLHSETQERSSPVKTVICQDSKRKQCLGFKEELEEKEIKGSNRSRDPYSVCELEYRSKKNWNLSTLSKEDMEAIWLKKQEAIIKRERMMKYSYSHRERSIHMLEELVHDKESKRRSGRLEPWMNLNHGPAHIKLRTLQKQDLMDGLNSPFLFPRRSFSQSQQSTAGDESSVPNSPSFPAYMAATQSAKAKVRSMSTPRQRVGFMDTCFDHSMPNKSGLSIWSSYNGEPFSLNGKSSLSQRISASLKDGY